MRISVLVAEKHAIHRKRLSTAKFLHNSASLEITASPSVGARPKFVELPKIVVEVIQGPGGGRGERKRVTSQHPPWLGMLHAHPQEFTRPFQIPI